MDKLMDIAEDPDTLVCVNPHHVNPVRSAKDTMTNSSHKWSDSSPQVKLEMEEFRDLSSFVEPRRSLINTADELNTPIFDKDVFDFDIFTSSSRNSSSMTQEEEEAKDLPNEDLLIKLEGEALYSATNNHHHNHQQTMLMNSNIFTMDVTSYIAGATTTTNTGSGSGPPSPAGTATERIEIIPMSAVAAPPPLAARGGAASASYHLQCDRVVYSKDNRSPLSVGPFMPTSSRAATQQDAHQQRRPRLSLNVDLKPTQQHLGKIESNLSTPAIIDDVVGMEFNILDLVKNEDISSISVDEIFSASPNSSANTTVPGSPATTVDTVLSDLARPKRSRKRKTFQDFEEDDQEDEDYVPPFERSRRKVSRRCSDSESEPEVKPRGRPRGRPPRRADSLSSDCSKDSDANKYRELRDKNNEASRKSRLKRKIKEQEIEKEAEELNWKNVKLKAQVEELEKMVNNFRDNLFKIMSKS
ncbi:unnamed protein product [Callosobruchus maculatus]|nr:unnamed protein product [Callosobruchus maculatus]